MTNSVARWMRAGGLTVRAEFVTPWGICDLVGLSFDRKRVANRLKLKQTAAICSITRAVLLLEIPDVKTGKSTTLDKLVRRCAPSIPGDVVSAETERLVADRFVVETSRRRLQRVNGWMPLQKRLVAVELKLTRIEEAIRQALSNRGFAEESYVALPSDVARRAASNISRRSKFFDASVGLLGVARRSCRVLVPAHRKQPGGDKAIQFYCVEKFWRTRVKGN
ncbi:MAG: hypothetical protein V1790_17005 [Planctomycetota bacterium]